MKKFLVFSLAGLLIMAFSSIVYAQKLDFRASGSLEAVSALYQNIPYGDSNIYTKWPTALLGAFRPNEPGVSAADSGAYDRTNSYLMYRGSLKFDAVMGKEMSGTIMFELDSMRWGDPSGTSGRMGYWTADRAGVEIKNVYIDFGVPAIPVPMTMRVGLQPIGVRPGMFMITDGMGITGGIKVDPVLIAPIYAKALEGKDASSDDVDVYGLHVNAKVATFTVGGYGVNFNMNTYPLTGTGSTLAYGVRPDYKADMWWLGAYADGKLGPLLLNFDFVYDTGEVERRTGAPVKDVDYRGWATRLKVNYPWQKLNFGGTFMYASGADQKKTNSTGLPGPSTPWGTTTKKVGSYVTPPGSEQWAACQESLVVYGHSITASALPTGMFPHPAVTYGTNLTRGAIGGTWFAKVFAGFQATPWYKVNLEALYIGDTTKNGNTLGDAVKATGQPRDDKTIGWEINLINEIGIYKNLKWNIGLGVLFAGDALDQRIGSTNLNDSPKNPWIIATKLRYTF
ncbi:MAG: hypothetical protein QME90_02200 [Thermodesulfobacteriota bacterium]|nr:hypothetical protein [Thermodesulfobacteriota bacterium]